MKMPSYIISHTLQVEARIAESENSPKLRARMQGTRGRLREKQSNFCEKSGIEQSKRQPCSKQLNIRPRVRSGLSKKGCSAGESGIGQCWRHLYQYLRNDSTIYCVDGNSIQSG